MSPFYYNTTGDSVTNPVYNVTQKMVSVSVTLNVYLSHAYSITLTGHNNSVAVPTNLTVTGPSMYTTVQSDPSTYLYRSTL